MYICPCTGKDIRSDYTFNAIWTFTLIYSGLYLPSYCPPLPIMLYTYIHVNISIAYMCVNLRWTQLLVPTTVENVECTEGNMQV